MGNQITLNIIIASQLNVYALEHITHQCLFRCLSLSNFCFRTQKYAPHNHNHTVFLTFDSVIHGPISCSGNHR